MVKYLLIVGCGRSGTTLIQRVLSSHPSICGVRETFFYSIINRKERFNKRNDLSASEIVEILKKYWWMKEIINDWSDFSLYLAGRIKKNSRIDDVIYFSILDFCNLSEKCPVILEKTPEHFKECCRLITEYPNVIAIGVVRDPIDVILSYKKLKNGPSYTPNIVNLWLDYLREESHLNSSSHFQSYSYEDLTSKPDKVLASMLDFIGVDYLNLNSVEFVDQRICYSPEQVHHKHSSEAISINIRSEVLSRAEFYLLEMMLTESNIELYNYSKTGNKKTNKALYQILYIYYTILDFFEVNLKARYYQYLKIHKIRKRQGSDGL
jgi:hypothetical protein